MTAVTSNTVTPAAQGPYFSMHGLQLKQDAKDALVSGGVRITNPCVRATIVVDDETTNVRPITIQLQDARGRDIDYVCAVELWVMSSAAGTAFATGGSTGIAIGTDGALLATVAKKVFKLTSEVDGDIDLTWTDTGTESVSLWLILPNGNVVASTAFANT